MDPVGPVSQFFGAVDDGYMQAGGEPTAKSVKDYLVLQVVTSKSCKPFEFGYVCVKVASIHFNGLELSFGLLHTHGL